LNRGAAVHRNQGPMRADRSSAGSTADTLGAACRWLGDRINDKSARVRDYGGQRVIADHDRLRPGTAGEDPHRDPLSAARAKLVDLDADPRTHQALDLVKQILAEHFGKQWE